MYNLFQSHQDTREYHIYSIFLHKIYQINNLKTKNKNNLTVLEHELASEVATPENKSTRLCYFLKLKYNCKPVLKTHCWSALNSWPVNDVLK